MYGIYGNIYHQYTPNVSIYTSTMDPMGFYIISRDFAGTQTTVIPFQDFHPKIQVMDQKNKHGDLRIFRL